MLYSHNILGRNIAFSSNLSIGLTKIIFIAILFGMRHCNIKTFLHLIQNDGDLAEADAEINEFLKTAEIKMLNRYSDPTTNKMVTTIVYRPCIHE